MTAPIKLQQLPVAPMKLTPLAPGAALLRIAGIVPVPAPGLSAYEVAVANGFVGTEAEWLASLAASGGGGDVSGPGASVDGHVALFDGASGKAIKDGGALPSVPGNVGAFANDAGYVGTSGARAAISADGSLSYNAATGVMSFDDAVTSVFGRAGAVVLLSTDVTGALGFVPQDAAQKGAAGGYASLDGGGKVPAAQLPAYVDDVLEYSNAAAFPATGIAGIIYVALDSNKTWRWSGSAYVEISPSPGSTDGIAEGVANLFYTDARARAAISGAAPITYNAGTGEMALADAAVVPGTYPLSTTTVDSKGRITAAASAIGLAIALARGALNL